MLPIVGKSICQEICFHAKMFFATMENSSLKHAVKLKISFEVLWALQPNLFSLNLIFFGHILEEKLNYRNGYYQTDMRITPLLLFFLFFLLSTPSAKKDSPWPKNVQFSDNKIKYFHE